MTDLDFLHRLWTLDSNFQILDGDADLRSHKMVVTRYGKYYLNSMCSEELLNCLIHLKVLELAEFQNKK